ncbi:MAG: 50S ribosomal protein L18 [Gammaproteobacteria bacterium]|jgi:large subunit ribosomal protein L18|nr:50S ribosomal protein L18 [Gammaproteobacteria bacterium]
MSDRVKRKVRANIRRRAVYSICITKTPRHFRAQICDPKGIVIGGVSTLTKEIRSKLKITGNADAAKLVGAEMAKLIKKLSLDSEPVAFDRSGHRYHGRVAAFVESMRESGVEV